MADRNVPDVKRVDYTTWLTRLAWAWLALTLLLILIANWLPVANVVLLLSCVGLLIFTPPLAIVWLAYVYRAHFHTWRSWAVVTSALFISAYLWQTSLNSTSSLFGLITVLLFWYILTLVPIVTGIFLRNRDASIPLLALLPLIVIWAAVISVITQGSLIDSLVLTLNNPTEASPLWWFFPLWSLALCVIPLGIIGFFVHTIRLIILEVTADQVAPITHPTSPTADTTADQ